MRSPLAADAAFTLIAARWAYQIESLIADSSSTVSGRSSDTDWHRQLYTAPIPAASEAPGKSPARRG
jgi:hypothetical protein